MIDMDFLHNIYVWFLGLWLGWVLFGRYKRK